MIGPRRIIRPIAAALATALLCAFRPAPAEDTPEAEPFVLTARKCFTEAPANAMPMINQGTRLDMLDYYSAGDRRRVSVSNVATARIDTITDKSIAIDLTDNGVALQMYVLNPTAPKPIIAVIETLPLPMADSHITLFTPTWEPIEGLAPEPKLEDWLASKACRAQAQELLPFITASATLAIDDASGLDVLTFTPTISGYFLGEDAAKAQELLKPQLRYAWTGKSFKKLN